MIQLIAKMKREKPKPLPTIYTSSLDNLVRRMLEPCSKKRISAEEVFRLASEKLKLETESLEENGVQNLMSTIVFPETHQRWVNLIPILPPKTVKKESSGSQVQERSIAHSRSKERKENKNIMENNSVIFKSTEKKPIALPRTKSRSKLEKSERLRIPNLPPIFRSGSPAGDRKQMKRRNSSS
jgi:hypothetical protein